MELVYQLFNENLLEWLFYEKINQRMSPWIGDGRALKAYLYNGLNEVMVDWKHVVYCIRDNTAKYSEGNLVILIFL